MVRSNGTFSNHVARQELLWVRFTWVRGCSAQPNLFKPRVTLRSRLVVGEVHMCWGLFNATELLERRVTLRTRLVGEVLMGGSTHPNHSNHVQL